MLSGTFVNLQCHPGFKNLLYDSFEKEISISREEDQRTARRTSMILEKKICDMCLRRRDIGFCGKNGGKQETILTYCAIVPLGQGNHKCVIKW